MFGKLREKLKSWTKNLTKKAESSEIVEEVQKEVSKPEIKLKTKIPKKSKEDSIDLGKGIKKPESISELIEEDEEKPSQIKESKPEKKSFFQRITSKITKVKISEKDFETYAEELEMLLLENNVALEVTERIIEKLKKDIVGKELLKKEVESEIRDSLKEIIEEILVEPFDLYQKIKDFRKENTQEPYVILFCGINGTGKTTTIAKIANAIKEKKLSCVIAAGDTFRAASIEQIKTHGERIGVKVISQDYGVDPASVGFEAIQYAKKNRIDCVLIDTAGRMHTAKNLLQEIEKISKVCKPQTKIFVGESITGNDAMEQVRSFDWAIGLDGIILSKADIDEKGGTALSVGFVTKKPILYLGTGQEYEKIEPFNKKKFIEKLGLDDD